ncbi:DUF6807 family protein [Mangrovibacterium sp.]|uniref:DUF6807 family protein n=1 Tax=Mangrovibacterium sp. TaxID=1961364 RepID=UPI00356ADDB2
MIRKLNIVLFVLLLGAGTTSAQISIKKEQGGIWITDGGKNVAFYQKEPMGINQSEKRNNFLHPLMLPDGTTITENAPDDHPHHRGIFWAWHQILIDNKKISDGWDLIDFSIDVKTIEFSRLKNGDGEVHTTAFWSSPKYKEGKEAYLKETTSFTFHQQKGNFRIIHFTIGLTSLVDSLQLGGADNDKGYGGFSARIKLTDDVQFKSNQGLIEPQNLPVTAGDYIHIRGSIAKNGKSEGGIILYAAPTNPQPANSWILRKKASMQNAVFPGRSPILLEKDVPLTLKYSVVLYHGKIKERKIRKEVELDDRQN